MVDFCASGASPDGTKRCRAEPKEVSGSQGKPRAPEWWPQSFGRGLDDDVLIEAFPCQVWSFSVLWGRFQVAPGDVKLRPRRSLEVRGSPELQNGGLRVLEDAWMTTCMSKTRPSFLFPPPPCSRLKAPGTRLQAKGSRFQAPGSRLQAPGFRLEAPGSRLQAPGSRLQAPQAGGSSLEAQGFGPTGSFGWRLEAPG